MKHNKLIIFLIAIVFMLSVSFAFAADEDDSQIIAEVDDNVLESDIDEVVSVSDDSQDEIIGTVEEDVISAENDASNNVLKNDAPTVKMDGIIKRYNGGIWYKATFYDSTGQPLKNQQVVFTLNENYDYGWENYNTDSNGVAILKAAISNGNYKLNAHNLNTGEMVSSNIKIFNVLSGGKNINVL